jgi:energy-coupling factor transporter transmembrane protein EcfT
MSAGAYDFYVPGVSRLHRIDPRVKLTIVTAFSVVMFLWLSVPLLLLTLALIHLVLLRSGYPWDRLRSAWRAIAPLLLLIVLLWPVFDKSGQKLFSIGPVNFHDEALVRGVANAARIAGINFVFLLWVGTTDARSLVRGFVRLGLPFKWGMALTIGLRFIPTFASTFATVSDAQQSRGLVLKGWWFRRIRAMLPILVAALVAALRASEQLAMTLEARGFGASPRRTVLREIRMRPFDWLVLSLTLLTSASLLALTLTRGFGRDVLGVW